MVNGRPGPAVLKSAMVAASSVLDHTIVAWSMMWKLLFAVQVAPTQPGQHGRLVLFATTSASRPFWLNVNVVKHVPISKTCKIRRALPHDVLTGLNGVVGEPVPYHVEMVLESDHVLVSDQPSSVPL